MILEPCLARLLMKYLNSYPIRHSLNQWYANRVTIQPTVLADKLFTPPPLQINSITSCLFLLLGELLANIILSIDQSCFYAGNILRIPKEGQENNEEDVDIMFIDFEYSAYNYR